MEGYGEYVGHVNIAGGSGVATFYLTSDGTSTGSAKFSDVDLDSIQIRCVAGTVYQEPTTSLSGDKKTLTVTMNKVTGVTLLGISVLSAISAEANGATVRVRVRAKKV